MFEIDRQSKEKNDFLSALRIADDSYSIFVEFKKCLVKHSLDAEVERLRNVEFLVRVRETREYLKSEEVLNIPKATHVLTRAAEVLKTIYQEENPQVVVANIVNALPQNWNPKFKRSLQNIVTDPDNMVPKLLGKEWRAARKAGMSISTMGEIVPDSAAQLINLAIGQFVSDEIPKVGEPARERIKEFGKFATFYDANRLTHELKVFPEIFKSCITAVQNAKKIRNGPPDPIVYGKMIEILNSPSWENLINKEIVEKGCEDLFSSISQSEDINILYKIFKSHFDKKLRKEIWISAHQEALDHYQKKENISGALQLLESIWSLKKLGGSIEKSIADPESYQEKFLTLNPELRQAAGLILYKRQDVITNTTNSILRFTALLDELCEIPIPFLSLLKTLNEIEMVKTERSQLLDLPIEPQSVELHPECLDLIAICLEDRPISEIIDTIQTIYSLIWPSENPPPSHLLSDTPKEILLGFVQTLQTRIKNEMTEYPKRLEEKEARLQNLEDIYSRLDNGMQSQLEQIPDKKSFYEKIHYLKEGCIKLGISRSELSWNILKELLLEI